MKVAYICEPQVGGTYTSFLSIREGLLKHGIDYRCVPPFPASHYTSSHFIHDPAVDFVDMEQSDYAEMAKALVGHLERNHYQVVVILPGCYPYVTSMIAYLPKSIRCVARLPHNARGVYWPTKAVSAYLNGIVAVSPRLKNDLVKGYRQDQQKIRVIPNGVDTDMFSESSVASAGHAVYVGRLDQYQKNIFLLPEVLFFARQQCADLQLTVVGSGPDGKALHEKFIQRGLIECVQMTGRLSREEVRDVLSHAGVFILPSLFEGCSNSTLEAMACGCVPLLSRLKGITDFIVDDGTSGLLFSSNDSRAIGLAWAGLVKNRGHYEGMRRAARKKIETQFSIAQVAIDYKRLFEDIVTSPDLRAHTEPVDAFKMNDALLQGSWRRLIPSSIKRRGRMVLSRFGVSP